MKALGVTAGGGDLETDGSISAVSEHMMTVMNYNSFGFTAFEISATQGFAPASKVQHTSLVCRFKALTQCHLPT